LPGKFVNLQPCKNTYVGSMNGKEKLCCM
jgi:hypothetical protein